MRSTQSINIPLKKIYPRDSVRLFKSDFLEQFTHVHPVMPLFIWIPIIAVLSYRSFALHLVGWGEFLGLAVLGVFSWGFIEYFLHRFIFHYPAKHRLGKRLIYIMHGLHHEDPSDPTRLVMPPLPALLYAGVLYLIIGVLLGPLYLDPYFAGLMIGYLIYDYTHFYVHHFTPKNALGKYLKRYHMSHHFAEHQAKWGVSSPLWDYVFGTTLPKTRHSTVVEFQ